MPEVAAELDVAQEAEARLLCDPLERAGDGLQLRMVGRDAEPDEPPRRREPLDHVHLGRRIGGQKRAGRVETSRAGADDRNPEHGCDASRACLGNGLRA